MIPNGTWTVDPAHSGVGFRVKHLMIATVKGKFGDFEGTLSRDDEGIRIAGTVRTASIDTGNEQRDAHLRSPDFFDAEAYPEITFASTDVQTSGDKLRVAGDLTIKGVTRPIVLEGQVTGTGRDPWGNDRVGLELEGEIDRTAFGLTWNQALETGGVLVGDRVKLSLEASAVRAAAVAAA